MKWFFVFNFPSCFSFQSAGRTHFEFSALHLAPSSSAKTWLILSLPSSRGCLSLHLRLTPAWIAPLPLKELLLSGKALLALLENVPYTLTPLTFTLLILLFVHFLSFTPGEFMFKAEASPSDALNKRQSEKKESKFSHINLDTLDGYPGHPIYLK